MPHGLPRRESRPHEKPPRPEPKRIGDPSLEAAHELATTLAERLELDEIKELKWALKEALDIDQVTAGLAPHPALEGLEHERLTDAERVEATLGGLFWRFALRRQLIEQSLSAEAVADRLGLSLDDLDARRQRHELIAIRGSGDVGWLYPDWQFDDDGPDGTIEGLPRVLLLLEDLGPLQQAAWLTQPKAAFDGHSPIDALRASDADDVAYLARRVSGIRS